MSGLERLSVNIDSATADALSALAAQRDGSVTDAVRSAVLIYKALVDELAKGRHLAILSANRKRLEVWHLAGAEGGR